MADSSIEHQRSSDRFALLVLGMHRSGTSAVTRVVSLLGADLPTKLMEPSPGENEVGFWESAELYKLQEELLASGGSSWDDWRLFNPNWLESPAAGPAINRIVEYLQSDFAKSPLFVVKDPRSCRLMPVWKKVLDNLDVDARILLPVRNPLEVAQSLRMRNGMSLSRAYIVWLRHVLDAEYNSRDIPRLVFDYDDLLQDWRSFASKSSEALGITWPAYSAQTAAKIDAFLSSSHRHHVFDEAQLLSHPSVSEWVKQTYSALKMLIADPQSKKAFRLLNKIRSEFDQAGTTFGEIIATEEIISQQLESRLVISENSCEGQRTQINDVEGRAGQLQEEKGSLESRCAVLQSELEGAQAALSDKSAESDYLQSELKASQAALSDKSAESEYLQSELGASQAALSDKSAESEYLQSELGASQATLSDKSAESVELRSEVEGLQATLSDKSAESVELRSEVDGLQATLSDKSAESVELRSEVEGLQATLSDKSAESVELRSEVEGLQATLSDKSAESVELRSEVDGLQATLSDKSAESVELRSEVEGLQATLSDKSAESVELRSEVEGLQATLSDKLAKSISLQSEVDASQAELSKKSDESIYLELELEYSQAALGKKSAESISLQSEVEALQAVLSDRSAKSIELQSEVEDLQTEVRATLAESISLQSELETSQAALSDKSAESTSLQSELDASQAEVRKTSAESISLQSELETSQAALSDKSEESTSLQSELDASQAALSDKSAESTYLQSELDASQAALSDKSAESTYLQSELDASQAALSDKSAESTYLQSELDASQAALSDKSAESNYLQSELASSQAALSDKSAEFNYLQSELDASQAALGDKSAESTYLQSELASSQAALSDKSAESNYLQSELADSKDRQEKDRRLLLSEVDNEKLLRELYADSRSYLLHRLNEIQTSNTWRLAQSAYNIEQRRPWMLRGVAALSVALRGFTVLHPIKYWRLQRDARVIHNSGLFDWDWYLEGNADIVGLGVHPLKHWLSTGWKEGRKPNPFFDTSWYVQQYLSDSSDTPNPLLHYIQGYASMDLEPNSEFNTKKYLRRHPEIEKDGINPLAHFLSNQDRARYAESGFDIDDTELFLEEEGQLIHHDEAKKNEDRIDIDDSAQFLDKESHVDEQVGNKTAGSHQRFEEAIRFGQQPGPLYEEEKPHPNPNPLVRAIAFYLPQFHPIPENDKNWGKGFTEWTNTSRTLPRFKGHYQPRMPGELGYYDLRNPEIHRRQIELAKANGIAGFCYHHYWFNGKKVLRMPLERHFSDPTLDLGFCINWANEPWTAAWDGHSESGVLVEQSHSPEDDLAFIQDIEPYLRDPRYIRVEGKPLLSIYRPTLFPNMRETVKRWQDYCIDQGIGELFIVMVQSFEFNDPQPYGFDGAIEFPPHNAARESFEPIEFFPDATQPGVWDYNVMAEYSRNRPAEEFSWFRGVTLGWDNSARKLEGWVFQGCDPQNYGEWLQGQCDNAMKELPPGQRLVFINAWNEWAEGTYLEPDAYFGYAFLNRTGEVLQKYCDIPAPSEALLQYINARHDDTAAQWLTQHIARFGLPVTSDEVDLAEPSDSEVDSWFDMFVEIAGRNADRLSESEPDVSIVIPVYNQIRYTISCLVSLLSHPGKYTMELLIGDDCSTDGTGKLGSLSIPGLRYMRHPNNLGFLRNCNEVAASARGRYIVMLNNDTVTLPEWLDSLIDTLDGENDVGLVGSKLVYPDGRLQEAGGVMWEDASGLNWGNLKDPLDPEYNYTREVDYCSGASIALSTKLWRELEGFDGSRYQNAYYEDTDLAFRVREDKKLRVVYQPLSHLLHFEGVSSGRSLDAGIKKFQKTNQPIFVERWREVLANHGTEFQHPDNFLCRGRTKNLLLIDWITPMPDQDSGSADTFNYLKIFGAMGFNVTLLPEKNGPTDRYVRAVQQMGVRVLHEPYVTDFESMLKTEVPKADVIFVYRGSAHRHTPLIRQLAPDTPIVFDTVDLHFLREEREAEVIGTRAARKIAAQTKEQELQAMKLSDVTIVLSEYEEKLLDEIVPDVSVARIPIVREIPGRSSESFDQRRDVVFIGGFLHKPNVNAVQYFVKKVWPLVRRQSFDRPCRFVIAGSNIPPEISKLADTDIVIRGFVEDLNDLFDSALISVSPLQYGAGLKGKVVSSLSYGVPVVCTAISAEGSGLEHGNNVMIADAPEDMCQYITELHRDAQLWQQLSDNGLEFCMQNFSLQAVGVKLEALLDQLKIS